MQYVSIALYNRSIFPFQILLGIQQKQTYESSDSSLNFL